MQVFQPTQSEFQNLVSNAINVVNDPHVFDNSFANEKLHISKYFYNINYTLIYKDANNHTANEPIDSLLYLSITNA